MTRINTNISSLLAQNSLAKSNAQLQTALTRLSTGYRINSGKDDPAGLIASEALRSDIAATQKAISNTQRADQIIATADSAIGQISSLLNDIRALVTEAANDGAMTPDQVAANQLQIDSSLASIDRISQTTNFQGRKLLDGSLAFNYSYDTSDVAFNSVSVLQIDQAVVNASTGMDVTVSVSQQAQQAYLRATVGTGGDAGTYKVTTTSGSFNITAPTGTDYDFTNLDIIFAKDSGTTAVAPTADYDTTANSLTITVNDTEATSWTAIQTALATTTVDGAGPTIAFTLSDATQGVEFNPLNDVTGANTAATQASGFLQSADYGLLEITSNTLGYAGNITIHLTDDGGDTAEMINANTMVVHYTAADTTADIMGYINDNTNFTAEVKAAGTFTASDTGTEAVGVVTLTGSDADHTLILDLTSLFPGADFTNIRYQFNVTAGGDVTPTAEFDTDGNLTVNISNQSTNTVLELRTAINDAIGASLGATLNAGNGADAGDAIAINTLTMVAGTYMGILNDTAGTDTDTSVLTLTGGANAMTGVGVLSNTGALTALTEDVVFRVVGASGSKVFNFTTANSALDVVNSVNLVSDSTGVSARLDTTTAPGTTYVVFESTGFGSDATETIDIVEGGATFKASMVDRDGSAALNSAGTDIAATINGVQATGKGNTLSINTSTLAMTMTVIDPTEALPTPSTIEFTITGGGAMFQLGANVVTNQQANIGIQALDTGSLRTSYGVLYELSEGQAADLYTDIGKAGRIIENVVSQVVTLRGRLGAFQKTTLQTNLDALNDTLLALTDAESTIRDADFAAETANLTRAQILVQSGTSVLQIANQNPQNVLALLRG
ncbi:MAG: hypothetical protein JXB10_14380 [Pirellulales bacterium]|nr:hypothetical protein [Pirellulales bacterium]